MKLSRLIILLALAMCSTVHAEVTFSVSGVGGAEKDNVMAYLQAASYRPGKNPTDLRLARLLQRIENDVSTSLEPFGYYAPVVNGELSRDKDDVRVTLNVAPGEPTLWQILDIGVSGDGESEPAFQAILSSLTMQPGRRALHSQYDETKKRLRRAALDMGYLGAEFESSEILINPATRSADVHLVLQTGEKFHFGKLIINQDVIDDELLARYVNINEGEHFSSSRLLIAKQTLYATDFFSTVDVSANRADAVDGQVPVHITAEKGKRHRYGVGLGYGTDTGYRVSGNWTMRRINRSGHSLAFDARYSPITWNFNSSYIIPIGNPVLERLALSAGTVDEDLGDANSKRLYARATIIRVPGDWQRQTSLSFLNETSTLVNHTRHDQYWVPSLRMIRTWSETRLGPVHGFKILGEVQASGTGLGLETNYLRASLQAKLMMPVGSRGKLLLRGEVGTTWTEEFDLLPVSRRFFTGGDDSVRGYRYNSISPPGPSGNAVGGKHLVVGSVEYDHTIKGPWGVAAFADSGNAFNSNVDEFESSVGVGLRWRSKVGVVRIDIAQSISDPERAPRLHVSVGPEL